MRLGIRVGCTEHVLSRAGLDSAGSHIAMMAWTADRAGSGRQTSLALFCSCPLLLLLLLNL